MNGKFISFISRYKILHIIFWVVTTFSLVHEIQANSGLSPSSAWRNAIIIKVWTIISVYTTIWFLLPRFLTRRKYGLFILLAIGTIVISSAMTSFTRDVINYFFIHKNLLGPWWMHMISHAFDITIHTLFFIAFAVIGNWFEKDRRNMILEREKLETEMVFLKAQMNPHFIFNALNSIYVLIDEDRKQASDALLKFSSLLRYQLYDCAEERMPLLKEIDFIKNYIQLEMLRSSGNADISVDIKPDESSLKIAPFILQPFVENAFKHVSRFKDQPNKIRIESEVNGNNFRLMVLNTYEANGNTGNGHGIGLKNVRRRLELLYPDKYRLQISDENNIHTVNLLLNV